MFQTISTTLSPTWVSFANATPAEVFPTILDINATTVLANASEVAGNATPSDYHSCDPSNPEFDCSIDDFLNFYLGAKQMPLETAIWVS